MYYFRPGTDTIDTILPTPGVDRPADLAPGLHPHVARVEDVVLPEGFMPRLAARLALWREIRRGRLALRALSDSQLLDIGVGPAEAGREARKVWLRLR